MELKLDTQTICKQCKKRRVHADVCKMKEAEEIRQDLEVEYSICGFCGRGYCSLTGDPDERLCEFCKEDFYQNVKEDGTLETDYTARLKKD